MSIRKTIVLTFVSIAAVLIFIDSIGTIRVCGGVHNSTCISTIYKIGISMIIFLPASFFVLVVYFMSERVFKAWFSFAKWAIPVAIFLIAISPEYGHDLYTPIEKGTVALAAMLIFSIVSIVIILRNRNR
jgi:hypothetical protein